jgi:hypothetical protein
VENRIFNLVLFLLIYRLAGVDSRLPVDVEQLQLDATSGEWKIFLIYKFQFFSLAILLFVLFQPTNQIDTSL